MAPCWPSIRRRPTSPQRTEAAHADAITGPAADATADPRFTFEQLCDAEDRAQAMRDPHQQLRLAVQQAEGYRTYLSSLTGLLAAVFVLKGQEDLSKMSGCPRSAVISLLIGGFAGLIVATWLSVLATDSRPGVEVYSEPNRLLTYEKKRTRTVWRLVEAARWLGLFGVLAVAAAVVVTWVAPVK